MIRALATYPSMDNIDLAGFDAIANAPGITILDFTAAWCGPCKMIKPILESLAGEQGVRLVGIDVDEERLLAARFLVKSMPTVVLWRDGREVGRVVGARPRAFFKGVIERALAGDVAIASP